MAATNTRDESFDELLTVAPKVEAIAASLPPPRPATWLLDLAAALGCTAGSVVLDAGGWAGHWARELERRYGCHAVLCDIAATPVADARVAGTIAVRGDLTTLPFADGTFDLAWCRDVLSMVPQPHAVLAEAARVLRPGGGLVLYSAFPTERLEPRERAELFAALGAPAWWGEGADHVRALIERSDFEVVVEDRTSPEHTQAGIEARTDLLDDWVSLARLERAPEEFRAAVGDHWYEKWRAWNRWSLYLLLGKLETWAWALRRR